MFMCGAKVTYADHIYWDSQRERYQYVREFPAALQAQIGKVAFKRSYPKGVVPTDEMRHDADAAYYADMHQRTPPQRQLMYQLVRTRDYLEGELHNRALRTEIDDINAELDGLKAEVARQDEIEKLRADAARLGVVMPIEPVARDPITASQALIDLKSHPRHKRGWRNARAEKKFDQAKLRAVNSLCAFCGTDDLGVITRKEIQDWADDLDKNLTGSIPHDYVADAKALFAALHRKGRFGDDATDPAEKVPTPIKPESKARQPFEAAKRILEDSRAKTGLLRWVHWIAAYTATIESEIVEAPPREIRQIGDTWVWYIGENRVLKSGYRARIIPLHPALIREGFLDYVESRKGKRTLFDESAEQAEHKIRKHRRALDIPAGSDQVFYSWRNAILRQIDDLTTKARADYLAGHTPGSVRARNYQKRIAESRHFREEELPELVNVVGQFEVDAPEPVRAA